MPPEGISFKDVITNVEKRLIESTLDAAGGVQKRAAELLGIKPTTLNEMIKRHDIGSRRKKEGSAPTEGSPASDAKPGSGVDTLPRRIVRDSSDPRVTRRRSAPPRDHGAPRVTCRRNQRRVGCLFRITTGPRRSHPTAQACAAGTPRCRGPQIALEGLL